MAQTGDVEVSDREQMALPAQHGIVGVSTKAESSDLGDAVLLVPGGASHLRNALLAEADWDAARSGFGDPALANQ
jgi:hypothetical protein